jgi:hypothetical protein
LTEDQNLDTPSPPSNAAPLPPHNHHTTQPPNFPGHPPTPASKKHPYPLRYFPLAPHTHAPPPNNPPTTPHPPPTPTSPSHPILPPPSYPRDTTPEARGRGAGSRVKTERKGGAQKRWPGGGRGCRASLGAGWTVQRCWGSRRVIQCVTKWFFRPISARVARRRSASRAQAAADRARSGVLRLFVTAELPRLISPNQYAARPHREHYQSGSPSEGYRPTPLHLPTNPGHCPSPALLPPPTSRKPERSRRRARQKTNSPALNVPPAEISGRRAPLDDPALTI